MSDQNTGAPNGAPQGTPPQADDAVKNLKAEMDRKLSNQETLLKQISDQLRQSVQPKPEPIQNTKKVDDVWYSNAEEAAQLVEERAVSKAVNIVSNQMREKEIINGVYSEFPELMDQNSELYKKAQDYFSQYSPEEKKSARATKAAVLEAATDLGLRPKSKRQTDTGSDSFSLGGSSGTRQNRNQDEVDPGTIELAQRMGVDPEKVKARIKSKGK